MKVFFFFFQPIHQNCVWNPPHLYLSPGTNPWSMLRKEILQTTLSHPEILYSFFAHTIRFLANSRQTKGRHTHSQSKKVRDLFFQRGIKVKQEKKKKKKRQTNARKMETKQDSLPLCAHKFHVIFNEIYVNQKPTKGTQKRFHRVCCPSKQETLRRSWWNRKSAQNVLSNICLFNILERKFCSNFS